MLAKTIRRPSGDQSGREAMAGGATWVTWRRPVPSGLIV